MFMFRNHLKSRSYWSRSQNWRSERIEYSAINSSAFTSISGGIDGPPKLP